MIRALLTLALMTWASLAQAQAQGFGGLAMFDAARSSVDDARFGGARIVLGLSQGVPWRLFTLTDPNRLVLDFREVDWLDADPSVFERSDAIERARMGSFRPGWSRLVLALSEPATVARAGMEIDPQTGAATLTVDLHRSDQIGFERAAGAPRDPRWDLPDPAQVPPVRDRERRDGALVVMIDPGHGGIDPGARNGTAREADLVLAMARELREVLRRAGGFDVRMTRDADVFVPLETRVAMARAAGSDLFVSLHADALEIGSARGATVYTLSDEASDAASAALAERHDRDDLLSGLDLSGTDDRVAGVLMDLARQDNAPRSLALARHIVEGIENAVGRVHKDPVRQADFSVLKAADIPSVLVELGFLSTDADLKNLNDPVWRASMAAGLRDGILRWVDEDAALAALRRR